MKVHEGNFIFIKEDSFNEYQKIANGYIPSKASRPFCLVISDPKNPNIYWAVPISSSSIERYKERALKAHDKFRFYPVLENERCFNLSCMIPILSSDVADIYKRQGRPVKLRDIYFSELKEHVLTVVKAPDRWKAVISQVNVKELYAHVAQKIGLRKGQLLGVEVKEQTSFTPKTEVLPDAQRELWSMLKDVPNNFVLYGGTAVALRYGHREPVDFNFFSSENKGSGNLYIVVSKLPFIKRHMAQMPELHKNKNNSRIDYLLEMNNGKTVQVSFVDSTKVIPGSINAPDVVADNGILIASPEDLMATTIHSLGKRQSVKDLVDISAMIKNGVSLNKGFEIAMRFRQDTLSKDFDVFCRIGSLLQNPAGIDSFCKKDKDPSEDLKKFLPEVKQIIPAAAAKLNLKELVNTQLKLNKDLSHGIGREKDRGMEL